MNRPGPSPLWVFALMLFVAACQPQIGDSCKVHANCSSTGGRICEPNFPGGYCTVFNCEPGTCPDESACVAYGAILSTKTACSDPGENRLERTFCMRKCSSNGDCRDGYECLDLSQANPWGAEVVENGSNANAKVCGVPLSPAVPVVDPAGASVVCSPPFDASFPGAGSPPAVPDGGHVPDGGVVDASVTGLDGGPPLDAAVRDGARDGS